MKPDLLDRRELGESQGLLEMMDSQGTVAYQELRAKPAPEVIQEKEDMRVVQGRMAPQVSQEGQANGDWQVHLEHLGNQAYQEYRD